MSEESGEPKPLKLKLSGSRNQPEEQQSAPPASTSSSASLPPQVETPPPVPQHTAASKLTSTPETTPPPLPQKTVPQTSSNVVQQVNKPERLIPPTPEKDDPLGSIIIIMVILLILGAAGGGIWFLLRSDQPETTESTKTAVLDASPSNPIERAKAAIEAVPNLDQVLETEPVLDPDNETATVANAASVLKESVSQYLRNIHVGGVRTGPKARIMLDGENYDINDTVDIATGLIFTGTHNQQLQFKDRNGTVYVKSF